MAEQSITVPIYDQFDKRKPIGTVTIQKSAIPETPDWVLALGCKITARATTGEVTRYELKEMGMVTDANYKAYLDQEKAEGHQQ